MFFEDLGAFSSLFVYFVHFTANNQFASTKYQLNPNIQHAAQAPALRVTKSYFEF